MSETVGILSKSHEEMRVEWRIADFFSLSEEADASYTSPSFEFLEEPWYLQIHPNGKNSEKSIGWIGVYLYRVHSDSHPLYVACSFSLRTAENKRDRERHFTYNFVKYPGYGYCHYLKRTELVERRSILAPSDVLTILCSLNKHVLGFISRTEELSRDLLSLMEDETGSDVSIRVQEEEFRLHRNILGARSHVLSAMFGHEMSEKTTGVVSIEDCEADVFRTFVRYLYSGKVDELSVDNVFDLFKVADKYQVLDLAYGCVQFMANNLTVETFCDAIEVALNHQYEYLMNEAIVLLSDKMEEIIRTEQWQKFLVKNPLRANKLLEKAFDRKKIN